MMANAPACTNQSTQHDDSTKLCPGDSLWHAWHSRKGTRQKGHLVIKPSHHQNGIAAQQIGLDTALWDDGHDCLSPMLELELHRLAGAVQHHNCDDTVRAQKGGCLQAVGSIACAVRT